VHGVVEGQAGRQHEVVERNPSAQLEQRDVVAVKAVARRTGTRT
jgi:hypothetical protein